MAVMHWCINGRHWATMVKNPDPNGPNRLCDVCDSAEFLSVVKEKMVHRYEPAPNETMGVKLELIRRDRDADRENVPA